MFHLVLHAPEIPPNTGNVMRLSANLGARLHLIEPLGFALDDRHARRAGLDYGDLATVARHASFRAFREALPGARLFAFSTRGAIRYTEPAYGSGDVLLFGSETRGLPPAVLEEVGPGRTLRIPMRQGSRSLNLANAVAVAAFEAWRQVGFQGAA